LTPTATYVAAAPSSPTPLLSIVASATTVAVLVPPDGTPVPLEVTRADDGASATSLMFFGGLVAVAVGAGVVVYVWRGRVT
jgi:hypothetical protein